VLNILFLVSHNHNTTDFYPHIIRKTSNEFNSKEENLESFRYITETKILPTEDTNEA